VSDLSGPARTRYVQDTFAKIAGRYDLLNRLMTLGQDVLWRRQTVGMLSPPPGHRTLDLGAGTGDLSAEVLRQQPHGRVIAVDITPEMIRVGKLQHSNSNIDWVIADGAKLPFESQVFSGVVSGFFLRNVSPLEKTLREQRRVLALGGAWASLDTTRPKQNLLRPLLSFYLKVIIPILGRWIARQPEAYTYLPASTLAFFSAEELAQRVEEAGISNVAFARRMFGTIAILWGLRTSSKA
jgi:demethylmenaquinone methyltransferase/2-methoxy-6-polyprenyl-1,4-benzoquinol methylase